jgi:tetratricopeptide (TPR) repeat protein
MKACVAHFFLALFLALSGSHAAAQSAAEYDSLVRQGNSQLEAGSNELALASATSAITANSGRWEAYAIAGGALLNLKRYEEAADQFSHAIDRAPEAKQEGLRILRKQCLSAEVGSPYSPSQSAASRQSAPPYPGPQENPVERAAMLLKAGQIEGALAAAEKAILANPNNAEPYFIKGQALVSKTTVDPHTNKLSAPAGCVEAYQMYLRLAPNGEHAQSVKGVLAGLGVKAAATPGAHSVH